MSKVLIFNITLSFILLFLFLPTISSESAEIQALLKFKEQLHDPMHYLENWNPSGLPCKFFGIVCDSESGQVTGISLSNLSLMGNLSSSVSVLHNLNTLELGANSISGSVPSDFSSLTNLRVLNLSMNSLSGQLPDLSTLWNLQVLELSTNSFTGEFPGWVGKLSALTQLGLGENNFDKGEIPESIGNLKNLTWLFLAQCNLIGEIPAFIYELTSLETLDLSRNQITGGLSNNISNLAKLYKIELFQNKLTGNIPPELANLKMLREFDISRNHFSGELPPEMGHLKMLTVFQIYQNSLWGELPESFGNLQFLQAFSIYQNNLSGKFPANLGKFSPLNSIDISENNFSGEFPRFLCEKKSLQFLLALDNNFTGVFPDSYAKCKSLVRFRVSQNHFTGKLPDGLWGLPAAVIIDIGDNNFNGGISTDIAISTSLTQLYVQNNQLSGKLPVELGEISQLQKILAFNNSFTGLIPSELGNLKQLSSLHLERNALTGSIPLQLGRCNSLVDINLAENYLSGNIPGSLALLNSLSSLNLSRNGLIGTIPDSLQSLKLSFIDFSDNKLSGRVPPELLLIAGTKAFSGNDDLCVIGVAGNQNYVGLSVCSLRHDHDNATTERIILVLTILLVLTVLLSGIAFVSYQSFKLEEHNWKRDLEEGLGKNSEWVLKSFHPTVLDPEEIFNLDEENLIAGGGSGKVYRLDLSKNRGTVAVKKLRKTDVSKILTTEIEIMGKVKHKNILKLYASLTGKRLNFLIFEYMQNGNLYQALHWDIKGCKAELDWNKRYQIAVGAAKGIMYLHHDCSPAIIHRDIKSTNILLDEEYEAKIADFGIAKLAEESESSCFVGTHGYMAPELAYSLKATEKSDIYSFGVVLLELLTGHSPSDPQLEGKDMVCWFSTHLNGQNLANVIDIRLFGTPEEDLIKVMKIAMQCTNKLPSARPTMREVVNMLVAADPFKAIKERKKQNKNFKPSV